MRLRRHVGACRVGGVDERGEKLTADDVAAALGIKRDTWYSYVTRGQAPKPDGTFGRQRWWWQATIDQWRAARPGPGARTDRYAPELRQHR